MPTPTGLPKRGEVWELEILIPGCPLDPRKVVVIGRGRGDRWALRVWSPREGKKLWLNGNYWLHEGWLKYVGEAGPKTRKRLGL